MNRDLDLGDLRRDFDKQTLNEEQLPQNPLNLFKEWFKMAEQTEKDPTAMVLSTAVDGQPNSRVVLLKKISETGMIFYTNYESEKGQELASNNKAALNFYWPETERQVRIRGVVNKIDPKESDAYFNSRPKESQIGATVSQQSREMTSRTAFENAIEEASKEFENKEVVRPEHWGGYELSITEIEFWQGRISRLHDRFLYQLAERNWSIKRLMP